MKKVAFHNLGCKVNSYEMDGILQMFQKEGYEIVDFAQKSDIYIINTCTVTNIADRKSRQMIHRAKALNPEGIVVAVGCYVQTDLEGALSDEAVDIAVGNNHKAELVDIVEKYTKERKKNSKDLKTLGNTTVSDLTAPVPYENISISSTSEHTRAFVKIQDGCNQFCSYCAIPLARGRVRSRKQEDILEELETLAKNGYREVVLTGIHLSSYGLTQNYNTFANSSGTNTELLNVIIAASKVDGIDRIRLGSLEPRLLTDEFVAGLSQIEKLCPHFHISLQSGCDEVLKRMNRHYDTKEYESKVELLRQTFEHPAITTDVIVGFPGETEEEFNITREYLNRINLYECHIFKYSRRSGTVADKMPGQLTEKVKQTRSSILIADSDKRKREYMEYYVGKNVRILPEEVQQFGNESMLTGYTKQYVKCAIRGDISKEHRGLEIEGCGDLTDGDVLYVKPCTFR